MNYKIINLTAMVKKMLLAIIFIYSTLNSECQITVNTTAPTGITTSGAVFTGNYNPNGYASSYIFKYYETSNPSIIYTTTSVGVSATNTTKYVNVTVSSLKSATNYTYQLIVNQTIGASVIVSNGNTTSFTTYCIPSLTVKPASNITSSSATLNGSVLTSGGCTYTYKYLLTSTAIGYTQYFDFAEAKEVTGLNPSTTYQYKIVATNGVLEYSSSAVVFTTDCYAPTVTTKTPSNLSGTAATLLGSYASSCISSVTNYAFEYGLSTSYGQVASFSATSNSSDVQYNLSDLTPNTTYHFRLSITLDNSNKYYGGDIVFTTPCVANSLLTVQDATGLTSRSATLHGSFKQGGCESSYNFEYTDLSTNYKYYFYGNAISSSNETQSLTASISNLTPSTNYKYRLNVDGVFSDYSNFTTTCEPNSNLVTQAATAIKNTSATLHANYISGTCESTSYAFQYGESTNYSLLTSYTNLQSSLVGQDVSFNVDNLSPNTEYHCRLVVLSSGNLSYGNDINFTTQNESPIITGFEPDVNSFYASNITSTGFKANWNPVQGAIGYNVNWKVDGGSYTNTTLNTNTNSVDITGLNPNAKYYFQVQTICSNEIKSSWSPTSLQGFTTLPVNQAPSSPNYISLPFGTHLTAPQSVILSWASSDPDGDALHFDLYTGSSENNLTKLATLTSNSYSYNAAIQGYYFWKVIVFDSFGNSSEGSINYFTVGSYVPINFPPSVPSNPTPENGSLWTSIHPTLSWKTIDPEGSAVKCDLYLGTSTTNITKVMSYTGAVPKFIVPLNNLLGNQTYYWKVIASDATSPSILIEGPIWSFTTCEQNQSITFNPISTKVYGDSDFDVEATASSGLAVTLSSGNTDVATIVNGKIHITGTGSATIYADQAGKAGYWSSATQKSQTLTVSKADQTITFNSLSPKTYGDNDFALDASTTSNLTITYSSSDENIATFTDGNIHIMNSGTCTIYANQEGNNNYNAAPQVSQQITINPKSIAITAITNHKTYGDVDPSFGYEVAPDLLNGDSFSGVLTRSEGENVGTYTIQQGTLSAGNNYSITFQGADFTITKKSLNVKAENRSKNYGEANPEFTLSFNGFANNEDKSVIDALPTTTCAAVQSSNSGSYPIELSDGSDNNYDLVLENGTLQVNTVLGTVNTSSIQNVTNSTADFYGELTSHGGEESIARGFVYATTSNPTILNEKVEVGSGTGSFSQSINGLTPNTKYYVRSYATNSAGTVYGNELFFTTLTTSAPTQEISDVTIYPNPTSGIVYLKGIGPKAKINLYDSNGAFLKQLELKGDQVNLCQYKAGVYFIRIILKNQCNTLRVIKM